jgi:flagellar biosynthesis repressor protein FlbT
MALRIELKPRERFILGGAVLRNGDARSELILENNVPILRGKNILSLEDADTPCKRIYFLIQLMYVEGGNLEGHQDTYWALVRDIVKAAPSMLDLIDAINEHLVGGRYYEALKLTRKLINEEERLTQHADPGAGLPEHP